MRKTIDILIDDDMLKDKKFDYRMYAWLLLQADDNNYLDILSFKKKKIIDESGIKHYNTVDNALDYELYIPQYDLFKQIPGNLKTVRVIPHTEVENGFGIYLDANFMQQLFSYREENSDKLIRIFLYFWKHGSNRKTEYKPSVKNILEDIGLQVTQKNRESVYKCLDWLVDKGFITYKDDIFFNSDDIPVPCLNIKWTWSNADGFDDKVVEEIVEVIEEKLPSVIIEEKPMIEEKIIEIEDWQKELAERMLGRSVSIEEYEKMLAKKGTLVTKEQWERNGGMTGQRTQEEYEAVILDRIKQVLKIA